MKRDLVVSLIGRPNVGKSSLFNRLMKRQHKALTLDRPGVTRDRHYGIAHFDDIAKLSERDIVLVDTGGFYPEKVEEGRDNVSAFFNIMKDHARLAINESDLVLFVVDAREGILPVDREIATAIRSLRKPFWLVVNKYDSEAQAGSELEFYELGVDPEEMFVLSAAHGTGIATLRERLHERADQFQRDDNISAPALQTGVTPRESVVARVALIGAPNAGKSTMLNQLLGSERALVSDIPGTTVDPIEGYFDLYFGTDAAELDKRVELIQHDGPLFQQYESFRQNNPDFFVQMNAAYEEEDFDETEDEMLQEAFADFDEEFAFDGQDVSEEELDNELYAKAFENEEVLEQDGEVNQEMELAEGAENIAPEGSYWRTLHIVDTAGIRRQKSIDDPLEEQSVYRSLRSITESDIVIYMVDATKGVGHQDRRLLDIALDKGKSVIVVLNKMDIKNREFKDDKARREWIADLRATLPWLSFCDVLPLSALRGTGLNALKKSLKKTVLIRRRPVPTGELNREIFNLIERHPVVVQRTNGKRLKVRYASMVKTDPPTILLFSNKSKGIPETYKRYLKKGIRDAFTLDNTPVHLLFRTGHDFGPANEKSEKDDQLVLKNLLLCLMLLSVGCSSTFYRNETVEKLDLERYMGKWYIIAHIPTFFVKDAYDAVETYTLTAHDEILVNFSYLQEGHEGRSQTMEQVGWVYDENTNAHWMIRPFWPLKFHYLIHYVNDDYSASMMGVPNHRSLWFMSRAPTLSEKERQSMEEMAESLGYDLSQLQEIPHQSK